MTFNEFIAATPQWNGHYTGREIECPLCNEVFYSCHTFTHLLHEHSIPCPCDVNNDFWPVLRSVPDPTEHLRRLAVEAALRSTAD